MKLDIPPGMIQMPIDEYHSSEALGHSGLVKILQSPSHFRAWRDIKKEPTDALAFGQAFHSLLLEPEKFDAEYAVIEEAVLEGSLQSADDYKKAAEELGIKVGKMKKDEIKDAITATDIERRFKFREDVIAEVYGGKQILNDETMSRLHAIRKNVMAHKTAARRLSCGGAVELSGFWIDQETGVECRIRPDLLAMGAIHDLKSCRDAGIDGFAKAIAQYGYDIQAAYYTDGYKALTGETLPFIFIAAETDAPYAVAVYQADRQMIEVGRKKYRAALQLYKWCKERDYWPSYQPDGEIETISLPRWATNTEDYELAA